MTRPRPEFTSFRRDFVDDAQDLFSDKLTLCSNLGRRLERIRLILQGVRAVDSGVPWHEQQSPEPYCQS